MSPLSAVKQLLKRDVEELKWKANQTFFNQLTKQQISLHEQSKRLETNDSVGESIVDPIIYYENRYFPLGFDDPDKLHNYQRQKGGG